MSRFTQTEMAPLYGICHYIMQTIYGILSRGVVCGAENIPRTGAFILAANHASFADPPYIGCHIPRQMSFFARKTLWKKGFASWWLNGVGCIPVDRESGSDVSAIKRVLGTLKEGKVLILFPEGTRSPDGHLLEAKSGVGLIASRTQVPVIPARIWDSHLVWGRGRPATPGIPADIMFGRPIYPAQYDAKEAGKDRYQRTSERIMEAIAALPRPPVTVV